MESESAWFGSMAPEQEFVGPSRSRRGVLRRSDPEQGSGFLPDQQCYRGNRYQHDQDRYVEAYVRSVTRSCPPFAYLPGGSLALVSTGDRRWVYWRFFALGPRLSSWITHQRLSLGFFASTLQVLSRRAAPPAGASLVVCQPPRHDSHEPQAAIDYASEP